MASNQIELNKRKCRKAWNGICCATAAMRSDGVATQDFSQSSTTLRHCYFARRARPGEAGRFGDVEAEPCVPENGDAHTLARLHRARAEVLQHEKASTARAFARNTPPRRAETDRKPRKAPIICTYKKTGISVLQKSQIAAGVKFMYLVKNNEALA